MTLEQTAKKENMTNHPLDCSFNKQYSQPLKLASLQNSSLGYSEILHSVVNAIEMGIIVVNQEEQVIYYNQKILEIWKISENLLKHEKNLETFLLNQLKNASTILPNPSNIHTLFQGKYEQIIEWEDGRFLEQSSKLIKLSEQESWIILMFQDITQQKNLEKELSQVLEEEKEANKIKNRFISMISHEFRTPLNIISFSNSLLKRHASRWTEEKKESYFSRIQTAVEQLNYLLDTILLIGRAELGKLVFEPQLTDLDDFCINCIQEFKTANSNHTLIYQNNQQKILIDCDQKLLHLALSNLITNACKYSPLNSQIEILLSAQEQEILLQVKDQGIGIQISDQPHLFEPFYRGCNIGETQGHGLGLAVVKKIIEVHQGTITVVSKPNEGTTFTILLPINDFSKGINEF